MVECPYTAGQISAVDDWFSVKGSVDYFNTCGTNEYGVPSNKAGFQEASTGAGYIGLVPWVSGLNNVREYVGIQLLEELRT
jgi:hypothetical protein